MLDFVFCFKSLSELADVFHRSDVVVSSPRYIVDGSDDEHCSVSQAGPVHSLRSWVGRSREETHDEGQEEECKGSQVDGNPQSTEVKGAARERLIAKAAEHDADNGDEI